MGVTMENPQEEDTEANKNFWRDFKEFWRDFKNFEKDDKFLVVFAAILAGFLISASAICPPLMLYAGVSYRSCEAEPYYTDLLIAGGSTWYIALVFLAVNSWVNRTVNIKKILYMNIIEVIIFLLFLASSTAFLVWWVWSVAEMFGPAHDAMRGRNTGPGIYGNSLMTIEDCKFWIFNLSFWVTMLPFMLMGYILFGSVTLACLGAPQD